MSPSLWHLGVAAAAGAVAVEIALLARVGSHLAAATSIMGRAPRKLRSPQVSDHWKERVATAYSLHLIKAIAGLSFGLSAAIAPFAAYLRWSAGSWHMAIQMTTSPQLLIATTLGSVGWWLLRDGDAVR